MRRRVRRRAPVGRLGLVAIVIALVLAAARTWPPQQGAAPPSDLAEGSFQVDHVVDGDTLVLVDGAKVRLIGVDTPEMNFGEDMEPEPYARQATDFTRATIGEHPVRLEFDRERHDKFGRFLAYAYVGDVLINEALLDAGLGRAMLGFPYRESMKTRFSRAQERARGAKRGIWSLARSSERAKK